MVYLPDPVFKNILDFCGDKELINLRGKDDTTLRDCDKRKIPVSPVKPGRVMFGSEEYDEYYSYLKWYKYRHEDHDNNWYSCGDHRSELDKKYEIYDRSDRYLLILKHYETQDGKRYSKYCRDYDNPYSCEECACYKGNKIYPRCYDCNIKYRKTNKTGFPKGKCLIKL